jgi:uncharacterized protein (TIGR03067 family)
MVSVHGPIWPKRQAASRTRAWPKTRLTLSISGRSRAGTWKIDPRKQPKRLDMTVRIFGGDAAICRLNGDELTIASNNGASDRPRDFVSAQITVVLKRKK